LTARNCEIQEVKQHIESLLAQLKQLQDSLAAVSQRVPQEALAGDVSADAASMETAERK